MSEDKKPRKLGCFQQLTASGSADTIIERVYDELRRLAKHRLEKEYAEQTLTATALVNEAYARIRKEDQRWDDDGHFFAAAAIAMRRIIVERARARAAKKRGGGWRQVSLDALTIDDTDPPEEILALDHALTKLEAHDSRAAQMITLRYFAGLTVDEAAMALGVSRRTALNDSKYAIAWLRRELESEPEG